MKRFVFRLARLERIREVRRREARARLALAASGFHDRREQTLAAESLCRDAARAELPEELREDPRALRQQAEWREAARRSVHEARELERSAEAQLREVLNIHTERAREHRVLERLREKTLQRWRGEVELEERKFLDEVHQLRVARERGDAWRRRCE